VHYNTRFCSPANYVQSTYIPTELPLLASTTRAAYRGTIAKLDTQGPAAPRWIHAANAP
jgi:hypothetical protein